LAQGSSEVAAQGVGAALVGAEGGLEAAVARVSLARVWLKAANNRWAPAGVAPGQLVQRFLATALHFRLALDLGEPLEAAGAGYRQIKEGLAALRGCVEAAGGAPASGAPEHPEDWQGLAGWTWVTGAMEMLVSRLSNLKTEK
jgi:hypothetical protein